MNKIILVLKNELVAVTARRSFVLTLLLVPVISFVVFFVLSALNRNTPDLLTSVFSPPQNQAVEGYVDQSDLIKSLPDSVKPGTLIRYASQADARQAMADGKIKDYYIVPPDYLASGKITYVRIDFNPISGLDQTGTFQDVLDYNLLGGNSSLAAKFQNPLDLQQVSLAPAPQREQNNALTFFLPYAVTFLFYFVILAASGLMLNSITTEKQNRVLEILMVSITPTQMLAGKIVALGIVGLLQTLVWSGTGYFLLRLSGQTFNLSSAFQLPPSILAWGVLYFLLGYAIYASLMAGVGALVPNLREASQATTIIIMPLIVPLVLISALINDSNGVLAVVLSLFPLTAPVTMMTRLAAGNVPLWQTALAALLMVGAAWLILRSVSNLFRAQTLLSGQPFSARIFLRALFARQAQA